MMKTRRNITSIFWPCEWSTRPTHVEASLIQSLPSFMPFSGLSSQSWELSSMEATRLPSFKTLAATAYGQSEQQAVPSCWRHILFEKFQCFSSKNSVFHPPSAPKVQLCVAKASSGCCPTSNFQIPHKL